MKSYKVNLFCLAPTSFRTQKAATSLDINVQEKLTHELIIEADLDTPYTVGLIIGNSGSGKTTLATSIWGNGCFFHAFCHCSQSAIFYSYFMV